MRQIIDTEKHEIKLWLDELEDGAMEQAKNLANLPFVYKWVSIMPDSHRGYGMPIGGVLPTKDVIIPNAVGVDIGCGMCAVKTDIDHIPRHQLREIVELISQRIPVGFSHHSEAQSRSYMPVIGSSDPLWDGIVGDEYQAALRQIGTLGGGNHFIELQEDDDGTVWIMIHSGSRNIGYKVAKHYHELAVKRCKDWYSDIPTMDLAFFPKGSQGYDDYMREMNYCVAFALANRKLMMQRVKSSINDVMGIELSCPLSINKPHNFASIEHHMGSNVIIHRKGACRARQGEWGMIPGSQGATSYIVKGKGEVQSFKSCSHGAGRKMSRREAKESLSVAEEVDDLNSRGILHAIEDEDDLDEAPSSYKNIEKVMILQRDLVDIEVILHPLAVVKG